MTFPHQTSAPMVGTANLAELPSLLLGSLLGSLLVVLGFVAIIIGHGAGAI